LLFLWDQVVSAKVYGSKELVVTFLDVGQGDCILVETPEGRKFLIDGGGVDQAEDIRRSGNQDLEIGGLGYRAYKDAVGAKVVVPFLRRKGINQLDLVILTHPHADHVGGLNEVLEEIKVDQVLDSGQIYESQAYKRFRALIEANKIKYSVGRVGQVIHFAENIVGYILNPFDPLLGDPNSDSVVMRLVYGDVSFLFTGDMERSEEERILRSSVFGLQSSVLKVGHHGSSTSTSDEFLKAVNPRIAVISVGKHNRYHHPHPSTLQKLREAGVMIYRTDEDGTVVIRTDGKGLTVESEKS
jgi:competence protein ComEC